MASVRPVRNGRGEVVGHRIDVKRTYPPDGPGAKPEQLRWSHTLECDPRKTAKQNRLDANAAGVQAERDLDAGVHPKRRYEQRPDDSRPMTVGDWVARWRIDRGLSVNAERAERGHLDNHILPTWRDVPLEDDTRLSRLTVQQWVNRMPGAPRSVRLRYGTFVKLINDAIDEPTVPLTASPCVRIRLPKVEPTGRRALTEEEVAAVAEASGVHRMLVWSLPFTGARISELLSRDIPHFKPLAGIELPPATRRRGEKPTEAPGGRRRGGKTPAAIRSIGLCGSHRAELIAYVGARTSGPLYLGQSGRRATYSALWKRIVAACEKVGIDEPVSPHWFRHTLETWLLEDGCAQIAIDEHLGHKTGGMVGVYGHVTPAMRTQILASLERRWRVAHGLPAEDAPQAARRTAGWAARS